MSLQTPQLPQTPLSPRFPRLPFPTIVHPFNSPTKDACAYESGPSSAQNALVFIGGLGDGPHSVAYPQAIAHALEDHSDLSYSVFQFRLGSSFAQFGFKRLVDDVADIAALVEYLRSIGKKSIVLMGHSTGTQDCMEYVSPAYPDLPPVDGFILQAPVADRPAFAIDVGMEKLDEGVRVAKDLISSGKGHERMPLEHLPDFFLDTPISAQRWYALAAKDGEDNYFDPEHPQEVAAKFWQRFDKPLLILHSDRDEFMPPSVDKAALIETWRSLCRPGVASPLSGVIPRANHRAKHPDAEKWLVETVIKFLRSTP